MKHIPIFIFATILLAILGLIAVQLADADIPNYDLIECIKDINLDDCLKKEIS